MKEILDFAIKMEKDGEKFYRELADKTEEKGLKNILTMMADDEVKHFHIFQEMKSGIPDMEDSGVLVDAKNVFEEMKEEGRTINLDVSHIELYEKAQEVEKESQEFYLKKAQETDNPSHKELWNRIAKEEEKHYFLLKNLVKFLSQPNSWLENAEFFHLDEF